MRRRHVLTILAGATAAVAWPRRAEARVLRVVTSSTDLAVITQAIARERVAAHSFFRGDQEPELWIDEIYPTWMVRASRADILVRIGLYADPWMDTVIEGAHNRAVAPGGPGYVDASAGIQVLEVPVGKVDRTLGEIHVAGNPHYLLDPMNAKIVSDNVLRALVRAAPEAADAFRANARAFAERLDGALPRWQQAAEALRGARLAAYHRTWSYFAQRFGPVVVGYCEPKPGIEPSPRDIRDLVETMAAQGARVIVHEPVYSPRIPLAVAREVERRTGRPVRVLKLPAHVGGTPEATDYLALFDVLIGALARAVAG